MRPDEQQTALPFESAAARVAAKTTEGQSTRPPRQGLTQYERVLAVMKDRDEVCGSELYGMYIPRFGAHLHRMRKRGYVWSKRPCDRHDWHQGTAWLYKLEALPHDPSERAS